MIKSVNLLLIVSDKALSYKEAFVIFQYDIANSTRNL